MILFYFITTKDMILYSHDQPYVNTVMQSEYKPMYSNSPINVPEDGSFINAEYYDVKDDMYRTVVASVGHVYSCIPLRIMVTHTLHADGENLGEFGEALSWEYTDKQSPNAYYTVYK